MQTINFIYQNENQEKLGGNYLRFYLFLTNVQLLIVHINVLPCDSLAHTYPVYLSA